MHVKFKIINIQYPTSHPVTLDWLESEIDFYNKHLRLKLLHTENDTEISQRKITCHSTVVNTMFFQANHSEFVIVCMFYEFDQVPANVGNVH